jgi:O-antigen ligase
MVATVFALFVLGRTPLLFLRLHTAELFWPVRALWQDDLVVACAMGAVELVIIAVAARRASTDTLLRQPLLLAFLAFTWLSMTWSVEPDVTLRRSLLLVGAVCVGWYVGDRFSLREQIRLVSWLGWTALGSTVVALFIWNDLARSTTGIRGEWSGIYVNRNSLGLVMSMGVLATLFFIRTTERKGLVRTLCFLEFFVLFATKSKTGLIGMAVAVSVAVVIAFVRRSRSEKIGTVAAAYVVFAIFATIGLVVNNYWVAILRRLGRDPDLTGRTFIWELVKWFSRLHPVRGWGFEAIWANQHAISQAQAANGSLPAAAGKGIPGGFPFAAHNGYYEILLGVGYVGLALFVGFLAFAVWRAFRYAWFRRDVESLWPLAFLVFAGVVNFSESLFVSGETLFVLTVAAAVAVAKATSSHAAADAPPAPAGSARGTTPDDVVRGRRG